jgi:anti-anti-sigma factor
MTSEAHGQLLDVRDMGDVTVVRFRQRTILSSSAIELIGEQLFRLVRKEGRWTVLLNFAGVESMTSAMLGKFVLLHRLVQEGGGRLEICCVDPFLMQIFKVVQMDGLVPIHADEAQGLQALSGRRA